MRTDIAIGGYIPVDSVLHGLDPRTKLLGLVAALIAIFWSAGLDEVGIVSLAVALAAYLTRVGWRVWGRAFLRFSLMLALVLGMNVLFRSYGRPITISGWESPITWEGLETGIAFTVQILLAIAVSMTLTLTTSPTELSRGVEKLAQPLKRLRVPVDDLGMIALLAMRFVPLLQQELQTTIDAQKSRGVEFGTGRLIDRARNLVALLTPVLTGALRRADLIAVAMTARGFQPGKIRSQYKQLCFSRTDWIVLAALLFALLCRIVFFS